MIEDGEVRLTRVEWLPATCLQVPYRDLCVLTASLRSSLYHTIAQASLPGRLVDPTSATGTMHVIPTQHQHVLADRTIEP